MTTRTALLRTLMIMAAGGCGPGTGIPEEPVQPELPPPAAQPLFRDLEVPASFVTRYTLVFANQATGERSDRLCLGTLSIAEQEGAGFRGTFAVSSSPMCGPGEVGRVSGTVTTEGDVELDLELPGAKPNELRRVTGCDYGSGASRFEGAVNRKKLVAISSATALCRTAGPANGLFELRVRIDAFREPPPRERP